MEPQDKTVQSSFGAHNPYGSPPGSGVSMPPYYLPTPSVKNKNNYFPQSEPLGSNELDHTTAFSTWSYETHQPISLKALRQALAKLSAPIYRVKGVIYTADAPQHRAVLQVVGRRVDISLMDRWGERTPRTQIVAIGAAGGINDQELRANLEQCVGGRCE